MAKNAMRSEYARCREACDKELARLSERHRPLLISFSCRRTVNETEVEDLDTAECLDGFIFATAGNCSSFLPV